MPEVISLLSSPPNNPQVWTSFPQQLSQNILPSPTFRDENFDAVEDIGFPIHQPLKKRKTRHSGSDSEEVVAWRAKGTDFVVDLSSDNALPTQDLPQLPQVNGGLTAINQVEDIDDILFSSSAPARLKPQSSKPIIAADIVDLSSDSLPDDPLEGLFSASQPTRDAAAREVFFEKTANILAGLTRDPLGKLKPPAKGGQPRPDLPSIPSTKDKTDHALDVILFSSPPKRNSRTTKPVDSATMRAEKAAEKEAEKEKKQAEKALKALEKQKAVDLAEVNKSRTNKKDAIAEMSVEMSSNIIGTSFGNQVEEYLKRSDVPLTYFEEQATIDGDSATFQDLGGLIRWRRKITASYDDDAGQWVPAGKTSIKQEQHVLVYLNASEVAMIASGSSGNPNSAVPTESAMKENLSLHVTTLRSRYPQSIPIYLIEGMQSWLKKNQNARNREYTAAVRAQPNSEEATDTLHQKRRKPKSPAIDLSFITEDVVEDLLLHLQLHHKPIFVQHTTSAATSALQILAFTQQLSTRPYRQLELTQNLKTASFCMSTGQVKTGDDSKDTYIKMMQEVQRVTPAMAYGIAGKYPSVQKLVQGFRSEGNLMLEDVRKSANKDGAWSDRRLGPMVSKRLYKVFMGRDPAAMDGMS